MKIVSPCDKLSFGAGVGVAGAAGAGATGACGAAGPGVGVGTTGRVGEKLVGAGWLLNVPGNGAGATGAAEAIVGLLKPLDGAMGDPSGCGPCAPWNGCPASAERLAAWAAAKAA